MMFAFKQCRAAPFLLLVAGSVVVIFVTGRSWLVPGEDFPYGHSTDLQIQLKGQRTEGERSSVYSIKSDDVEGEATLTPSPTIDLGQSLVNSQIVGVKSTFESSRAPYAGQITAIIDCHTKKFVKEQTLAFLGKESTAVLAVATGRHIFGSCSVDEMKYAAIVWGGYDQKRRRVLSVKLFKPVVGASQVELAQQEILRVLKTIIQQPGGS
jgi:hypothetical protein